MNAYKEPPATWREIIFALTGIATAHSSAMNNPRVLWQTDLELRYELAKHLGNVEEIKRFELAREICERAAKWQDKDPGP